jgi:hypothetical protein
MNMKKIIIFSVLVLGFFNCQPREVLKSNQEIFNLSQPITSDDILFRYYCISRLEGAMDCLNKLCLFRSLSYAFSYSLQDHKVYLGNKVFFNKCIVTTIVKMNEIKSIDPFLHIWNRICHYRYLEDSNIITEFTSLLVCLLSYTLKNKFSEEYKHNKNLALLDALDDMNISDILDILDTLVEEIPEILEKYNFDSDMGWYEWGKKYFIPATLSAILIGIKIYTLCENSHSDSTVAPPPPLTIVDLMNRKGQV